MSFLIVFLGLCGLATAFPPPKPFNPPFCKGRPNGNYGNRCETSFNRCWEGVLTVIQCNFGEAFDGQSGCRNEFEIFCKTTPQTNPPTTPGFCFNRKNGNFGSICDHFYHRCWEGQLTVVTCQVGEAFDGRNGCSDEFQLGCITPPQTNPPVTYGFCFNRANGNYGSKCDNFYSRCWEGQLTIVSCDLGEAYDGQGSCQDIFDLFCQTRPPTNPPVTGGFCTNRTDGNYGSICDHFYHRCWEGQLTIVTCQVDEAFDGSASCRDEFELGCRIREPTLPPVVPPFCFERADGNYGNKCDGFYHRCWEGQLSVVKCELGLAYNGNSGCQDEFDIFCRKRPDRNPPVELEFCAQRANGNYGTKCDGFYHRCWEGVLTVVTCQLGEAFDGFNGCQDEFELFCKQHNPTPTPVTPGFCANRANGNYGTKCDGFYHRCWEGVLSVVTCEAFEAFDGVSGCSNGFDIFCFERPPRDKPVTPPFCFERPNGNYGNKCDGFFHRCWEGQLSVVTCEFGEAFDGQSGCRNEFEIFCKTTPQTDPPTPKPFCVGRRNGNYGNKCDTSFNRCWEEVLTVVSCPFGQAFDGFNGCQNEFVIQCKFTPPPFNPPKKFFPKPRPPFNPRPPQKFFPKRFF